MSATISKEIGGAFFDKDGNVNIGNARPWKDKNGHSYINVNGQAVQIDTNALLLKDEWISYDRVIKQIGTIRLNGIADLRAAGLIYNAGDIGSTIAQWQTSSDMTAASVNMSGKTKGENDHTDFGLTGVPIPIIRKDFTINRRLLLASRRMGAALDNFQAQTCARLVAEASEAMLFNGVSSIVVGGYGIYGYTTHPNRLTGSLSADWSLAATAGSSYVADALTIIAALEAKKQYGPYTVYVSNDIFAQLRKDYSSAKGDNTVMQRLLAEPKIAAIKVADVLAAKTVVFVQLTSDVVDLAVAQDLTTVQWDSGDGMETNMAIMAAWAPRIKADYDSNLGIAHYAYP